MRRQTLMWFALFSMFVSCGKDDPPTQTNNQNNTNPDSGTDSGVDTSDSKDVAIDQRSDATDSGIECEPPVLLPEDDAEDPSPHTPRWAFMPWISKDISDRDDTYTFVDGFQSRGIPVGVVVLDSPWETNYNTFIPNPDRYPEFETMVSDLQTQGVRTVLWVTQMVNDKSFDLEEGGDIYATPSENFEEGKRCNYFVNDGDTYFWWKGEGAGVDFFNPDARAWWHRQQDALLEMGVAGWKLDFGEQYITTDTITTAAGDVTFQEYSEEYYRDFYRYGAAKVGTENFVTMVRGHDASYQWEPRFYARPEHAPVVWAGDNRRDFVGLEDALDHMFKSAAQGYVVVGSDLGGYLDVDDQNLLQEIPFDQNNFVRWVAAGALSPFMQLHGRANLEPWAIPVEPDLTVDIYRYYAKLHTELIPFFYSLAEAAYLENAPPVLRPLGPENSWPGDYRYTLGDAFLVAPILDATGIRDVTLPAGTWIDWWSNAESIGPTEIVDYDATDQRILPLFIKQGAIIPTRPIDGEVGFGTEETKGELHIVVYPSTTETVFPIYRDDRTKFDVTAQLATTIDVTIESVDETIHVKVQTSAFSDNVMINGMALAAAADFSTYAQSVDQTYFYDGEFVWTRLPASNTPKTIQIGIQ